MCKQEKASNKTNQETGETAYENSQQCNDQKQLITLKLLDCPALLAEAKGVLLSPVWLLVFLYHIAKAWGLENAVEGPKEFKDDDWIPETGAKASQTSFGVAAGHFEKEFTPYT